MNNTRNLSLDVAKGLCIILMVIGHLPWDSNFGHNFIESFHMPLFFMVSGFFFKTIDDSIVIKKSVKRLLVPLLIGTAVCILISLYFDDFNGIENRLLSLIYPEGTRSKDLFCPNMPDAGTFWFLAALFWCRWLFNIIHRNFSDKWMCVCRLNINFRHVG